MRLVAAWMRRGAQEGEVHRRAAHDGAAEPSVADPELVAAGAHRAAHNQAVEYASEARLDGGAHRPLLRPAVTHGRPDERPVVARRGWRCGPDSVRGLSR